VSGREVPEPCVHANVAVGEVLEPCVGDNVAVGEVPEPCSVAELPELFQLKCPSPALEARPHLNGNNPSIPRI
jgi:hypothetical protein